MCDHIRKAICFGVIILFHQLAIRYYQFQQFDHERLSEFQTIKEACEAINEASETTINFDTFEVSFFVVD